MKNSVLLVLLMMSSLSVLADGVAYTWTAPTLRTDGVLITGAKSYVVQGSYSSTFASANTEVRSSTLSATIDNLAPGTYYARIATIEDGRQGPWSPAVSVVLPALPAAPGALKGTIVTVNVTIGVQ
jgi:hypothetical protein